MTVHVNVQTTILFNGCPLFVLYGQYLANEWGKLSALYTYITQFFMVYIAINNIRESQQAYHYK